MTRLSRVRRWIRGPVQDRSGKPMALGVIRATWGSGDTRPEVTAEVEGQMRDGQLDFIASNAVFGDPTPNVVKDLRLRYTLDGKRHDGIFQEGEHIRLP